ncbi:BglG family transcription antiterminator LicT [Metabacillus rhizolycopersici]|uniref:PRD domain-containing protein n=1 Tax=Metabacillus rhizolycopersici TaxID=2875709 RepID=A0ABS7UNW1_9BACI|nr:PRD domain-containing protein [Metabacillus rhizolycopersici]MBZ5749604.1 PRD domain-containing protein [Metabacillus rhizolycopersici]
MSGTLKIDKVINNNLVRSHKDGKEVLVMGKGLGFKKQRNDFIDETLIERVYVMEGKENGNYLEVLLSNIPYTYVQTTNEIVKYAINSLDKKLDDTIWLGLTDHIYHAIDRLKKGITVRNALLWEISRFYNHEYLIGKEALKIIEKRHGVKLNDSEAGFIAIHLVNAQMDDTVKIQETMEMIRIQKKILDIVKDYYGIELNQSSIHYDRFWTHLKYFVRRLSKGKEMITEDLGFLDVIKAKYPNEYKCAKHIEEFVQKEMNCKLTEDEIIYLSIHIRRVIGESV